MPSHTTSLVGRKRRLSASAEEWNRDGDGGEEAKEKEVKRRREDAGPGLTGDEEDEEESAPDAPGEGCAERKGVETEGVKEVTKGVREVDLEDGKETPVESLVDATRRPAEAGRADAETGTGAVDAADIPLPEEKEGERESLMERPATLDEDDATTTTSAATEMPPAREEITEPPSSSPSPPLSMALKDADTPLTATVIAVSSD